jgi:uncharacterized tellurite resistance protein B-like protein
MFKKLFTKKQSIKKISMPEVDIPLRLMFEMAMIDGKLDKAELNLMKERVREIAPEDRMVSEIIKQMIDQSIESVSLYPTIKKINDSYSKEEKKELLAVLWQLVAVDKRIDPYEENLYFKIAGLIHIERTSANQIKQENL